MDAKELRRLLVERTNASKSGEGIDEINAQLKKPGRALPFFSWWWDEYLDGAGRTAAYAKGRSTYITEHMLRLSDEDLLLLWAVYCM